jgi:hypothetical protein
MKKSIIALTMVLALGLGIAAVNAQARGHMNGGGYGYGMMSGSYGMDANDADVKKFLDETAVVRKAIAMDRAELNALMAGTNPDPKLARELSGTIVDNQEKLSGAARVAGLDTRGFGRHGRGERMGAGAGHRGGYGGHMGDRNRFGGSQGGGYGNCDGPGYGRGYGPRN